jgi:hypothetical protein
MTISATVKNGSIQLLEPIPSDWDDGVILSVSNTTKQENRNQLTEQTLPDFQARLLEIYGDDFALSENPILKERELSKW